MKVVAAAPLLLLGAVLASIEGLPLDNRQSSATMYQDWSDAIELARNQTGIPGLSVAVLHRGKVIYAEGFGKRNDNNEPVTADTLMPIGSMTKAMTAAMIGELVAEGKLDWDKTPVAEYVPEAQFGPVLTSELTLSDYLSHRTGLPKDDAPWFNTTETRAQVFSRLKNLHLSDKLSAKRQYSNVGYVIAGEAAANVAKIPYESLVRNKIFRPLGLTHTGFSPINMGKRPNHSRPYYADSLKDAQAGRFHQGYLDTTFGFYSAAGDAYSNVYDLLKWGSTIMNYGNLDGKQVLNKAAIERQLSAHTVMRSQRTTPEFSPSSNYGFGWDIDSYRGQAMYSHSGAVQGFTSNIVLFPDSDLVITTLSNIYLAPLSIKIPFYLADEILNLPRTRDWLGKESMDIIKRFYDSMAEAQRGASFPPRLKNKPASHPLVEYEGVYSNPLYAGNVKITLETEEDVNGLKKHELHFSFNTLTSKVEHYHYETFKYTVDTWDTKIASLMTFVNGQDGKVDALQLEYLDETWTFKKQGSKDTAPSSSSMLSNDIETMAISTTIHHLCDDQEEVDIIAEKKIKEQSDFGVDDVQFRM